MKLLAKVSCSLFTLFMALGMLSISVFAADGGAVYSGSSYASSCQEIHDHNSAAPDGEYTILSESHLITLYCANMSTSPAEYLSFVQTGGSSNYSKAAAGAAWPGTDVITKYTKVRFDPTLAHIIQSDRTFSSSTGNILNGKITSLDYGSASTCTWNPQLGTANLDITGTNLTFALNQFVTGGWEAGGSITYSNGNQVVNLTGGGYCGSTKPINPYIQLNWQYQGLEVAATPVNVDGNSTVTAILKDAAGSPVANANIRFTSSVGLITASSLTDANGMATALLSMPEAGGTAQIEAVSDVGGSYGKTSVVKLPTHTLVIATNGTPGNTDAYAEFSSDNGQTWHAAYEYGSHPWGLVSGTNSWINCAPYASACTGSDSQPKSTLYRVQFVVPQEFDNARMTFEVKADNYGSVSLNGSPIMNLTGYGITTVDQTIANVIHAGLNEILINNTDVGGLAGLNYSITLKVDAPTAPYAIDKAPTASVSYNQTTLTNKDVVATITPSETVTVTNNGGLFSHTFSENGSFTFEFVDQNGQTGTAVATVSNIDKTPPVITVGAYNTNPTNQDVVVTVSTNEGTLNATSHTFTENGEFTFTATDAAGNVTNKTVTITNIDKVAPTLTVQANKSSLGAPNHKLVEVGLSWNAQDIGSGIARVTLLSVTSNEPDDGLGDGDTSHDIQGADLGTADQSIQLRAERSGKGTGRVYTITYEAVDFAGNSITAFTTVTVPHSSK